MIERPPLQGGKGDSPGELYRLRDQRDHDAVYYEKEIERLEAALAEAQSNSDLRPESEMPLSRQEIRQLLWQYHPCEGKYGDDGELQCNRPYSDGGPIDFKRDSWESIAKGLALHSQHREAEAKRETAREIFGKMVVVKPIPLSREDVALFEAYYHLDKTTGDALKAKYGVE